MVEEKESGSPGRGADSEEDKNNPLPGQLYSFSRHDCQTHLPSVSLSFICLRLESRLCEALQPPFEQNKKWNSILSGSCLASKCHMQSHLSFLPNHSEYNAVTQQK